MTSFGFGVFETQAARVGGLICYDRRFPESYRSLAFNGADVICVGHTHYPYVLEVGDRLVVNPGSIGLPRDGDPRGSYALLEHGAVELKRFEYPVEDTVRSVHESPLPGPYLTLYYLEALHPACQSNFQGAH